MSEVYTGHVDVFTFKEGMLSRMAHDLKLNLTGFTASRTGDSVRVEIDCTTLTVEGVVRGSTVHPDELSPSNISEIHENINGKILRTQRFPTAVFEGKIDDDRLVGDLTLCGQTRSVRCRLSQTAHHYQGQIEMRPSLWGIKPFKALMGAIRLQDRVRIHFDLGPSP